MPRRPAIPGHGLAMYGNPYESDGCPSSTYVSIGHGKCKCGQMSPTKLPTNADRRDWWRSHVDQVIAARLPKPPVVITWDWREPPDMDDFATAIRDLFGGHLHQVETGSDQYAVVLSATALDDQQVADAWSHRWDGEDS